MTSYLVNDRYQFNVRNKLKKVVIAGGTHGNELHGIYFVNELNEKESKENLSIKYPSIKVEAILTNPAAISAIGTGSGRRYYDEDLNRCFSTNKLEDNSSHQNYELKRAKELNQLYGPKSSPNPSADLIIDLHNTTSNVGIVLLCFYQDIFALKICAYLQTLYPGLLSVCVYSMNDPPYFPSVSRSGITIEVGSVPHSTFNVALYQLTKKIVLDTLNFIEHHNSLINPGQVTTYKTSNETSTNSKTLFDVRNATIEVYQLYASVGYPRDHETRSIIAFMHPTLQGIKELLDSSTLELHCPLFEMIRGSGEVIYYQGLEQLAHNDKFRCEITYIPLPNEDIHIKIKNDGNPAIADKLYPMFINEAAYMEKDVIFQLMVKKQIQLQDVIYEYVDI